MDNSSAHPHSTVTQQAIREEREGEALKLELLATRLYDAALVGDVSPLNVQNLNASILDRCCIQRLARGFTQSPLHIAADLGHFDFVNKILESKPELAEERDHKQGSTPLHLSSAKGHLQIVNALLEVNPNACLERDKIGRNPVHVAALKGQQDVLGKLLEVKPQAACERTSIGETVLHLCVKYNQLDTLNFLVQFKGNAELLNAKDSNGDTILHWVVATRQVEIVNALLAANPNVCLERNEIGRNPVHVAALKGHQDVLGKLLAAKPQAAYERTSIGETVLHLCVKHDQLDTLKCLVEFIGNAALLNAKDSTGDTILHWAVATRQVEIVNALLAVDPNVCLERNEIGRNPVHVAALKGHQDVLSELLKVKPQAAYERTSISETVLHLCVKHDQLDTLKFLVEFIGNAALLNAKDSTGDTILHWAVATRQVETLKFLLGDERIEKNVINANGYTARDICREAREENSIDQEIHDCLERAGALPGKAAKILQERDHTESSNLMVVASLIATMAFQVSTNPPGGVWQDSNTVFSVSILADNTIKNDTITPAAGESIFGSIDSENYSIFLGSSAVAFFSSMSVILFLVTGLRCNRFSSGILTIVMWIAL